MALWNQPMQEDNGEKPHVEHTPPIAPVTPSHAPREHTSKDRRESVFGPGVAIEGKIEGDADPGTVAVGRGGEGEGASGEVG